MEGATECVCGRVASPLGEAVALKVAQRVGAAEKVATSVLDAVATPLSVPELLASKEALKAGEEVVVADCVVLKSADAEEVPPTGERVT